MGVSPVNDLSRYVLFLFFSDFDLTLHYVAFVKLCKQSRPPPPSMVNCMNSFGGQFIYGMPLGSLVISKISLQPSPLMLPLYFLCSLGYVLYFIDVA